MQLPLLPAARRPVLVNIRFTQRSSGLLWSCAVAKTVFVDRLPLGLSESEKKVLQCFYEYRLSHKDIAQLYGISLEASRMKLFRARMHCRELLLKCEKYV